MSSSVDKRWMTVTNASTSWSLSCTWSRGPLGLGWLMLVVSCPSITSAGAIWCLLACTTVQCHPSWGCCRLLCRTLSRWACSVVRGHETRNAFSMEVELNQCAASHLGAVDHVLVAGVTRMICALFSLCNRIEWINESNNYKYSFTNV